jgi:hypothetical protein
MLKLKFDKNTIYDEQLATSNLPADVVQNLVRLERVKRLFYTRRRLEDYSCIFAFFGILFMQVSVELTPRLNQKDYTEEDWGPNFWIKTVVSILTLVLVCMVHKRYMVEIQLKTLQGRLPQGAQLTHSWRLLAVYFCEILACAFHIPPFLDFAFHIPDEEHLSYWYHCDTLGMFMWVRLYLLPSLIRNHSGFYSQQIAYVCALNNIDPQSVTFHFKAMFKDSPVSLLVPFLVVLLTSSTFMVQAAERSANEDLDDYWSSFWLTVITVSTIGYGDRNPKTVIGRIFICIGGVCGGVIIMALITTVFIQKVQVAENEKVVLQYYRNSKWKENMSKWAAICIQRAWRLSQHPHDWGRKWHLCEAVCRVKKARFARPEWMFLNEEVEDLVSTTDRLHDNQFILHDTVVDARKATEAAMGTLSDKVGSMGSILEALNGMLRDGGGSAGGSSAFTAPEGSKPGVGTLALMDHSGDGGDDPAVVAMVRGIDQRQRELEVSSEEQKQMLLGMDKHMHNIARCLETMVGKLKSPALPQSSESGGAPLGQSPSTVSGWDRVRTTVRSMPHASQHRTPSTGARMPGPSSQQTLRTMRQQEQMPLSRPRQAQPKSAPRSEVRYGNVEQALEPPPRQVGFSFNDPPPPPPTTTR